MKQAALIPADLEAPTPRQAQKAWRLAAEDRLLQNGYVTEITRDVSLCSLAKKGS